MPDDAWDQIEAEARSGQMAGPLGALAKANRRLDKTIRETQTAIAALTRWLVFLTFVLLGLALVQAWFTYVLVHH